MSSLWLRCITSFCLVFTALRGTVSSGVVWKNVGEQITIQCRTDEPGQISLTLVKGLNEEFEVLFKTKEKIAIDKQFKDRLQLNGEIPNVDILITNLTSDDTGPYWCVYKMFDPRTISLKSTKGTGSVLLVVTDRNKQPCDQPGPFLPTGHP